MPREHDIGEKRERIAIQRSTTTPDSEGQPVATWFDYDGEWASAEFLSVQEFPEMQKINAKAVVRFWVNYREDLEETDRIQWRDKTWNIHGFQPSETKFDMSILASRTE